MIQDFLAKAGIKKLYHSTIVDRIVALDHDADPPLEAHQKAVLRHPSERARDWQMELLKLKRFRGHGGGAQCEEAAHTHLPYIDFEHPGGRGNRPEPTPGIVAG